MSSAYTHHRLLQRQIKKITGSYAQISPEHLAALLDIVSQTYREYEKSQERSDRAVNLMSAELMQFNQQAREAGGGRGDGLGELRTLAQHILSEAEKGSAENAVHVLKDIGENAKQLLAILDKLPSRT